jgi:hypothetical protein
MQNFAGFTKPKVLIGDPTTNVQAELRGLMISRRADVSSSLWLGGFSITFFQNIFIIYI